MNTNDQGLNVSRGEAFLFNLMAAAAKSTPAEMMKNFGVEGAVTRLVAFFNECLSKNQVGKIIGLLDRGIESELQNAAVISDRSTLAHLEALKAENADLRSTVTDRPVNLLIVAVLSFAVGAALVAMISR